MDVTGVAVVALAATLLAGRSSASAPRQIDTLPAASVVTTDGATVRVDELVRRGLLSVLVFSSDDCPCFAAHRGALKALASRFGGQGVQFFLIDSERHPGGDRRLPRNGETGLPVLVDAGGGFARAVNANYATFSLVVSPTGKILYRGGITSARKDVNPQAKPYLGAAIESALAGRDPVPASTKALGCALRM